MGTGVPSPQSAPTHCLNPLGFTFKQMNRDEKKTSLTNREISSTVPPRKTALPLRAKRRAVYAGSACLVTRAGVDRMLRILSGSRLRASPLFAGFLPPAGILRSDPLGFDSRTGFPDSSFGDPCGSRTHVNGVRGRCLNLLTNGPFNALPAPRGLFLLVHHQGFEPGTP